MGLRNIIEKNKTIVETREKDNQAKKENFFKQIQPLDFEFSVANLDSLKLFLTNELSKMITKLENYVAYLKSKKQNRSSSSPYLNSIIKEATNLKYAFEPIGQIKINPNLLKNIHYRFMKLNDSLLKASKTTLPTRIFHSATLSYKPTKEKLKTLSKQLLDCEKQFISLAFSDQIELLLSKLDKLKSQKVLSKNNNIEMDIYYPSKKLGHYEKFEFKTNFENSDGIVKFNVSIQNLLDLIQKITKISGNPLYKKVEQYKKDEKIECIVCYDEKNISEFITLPCGHLLCKTCAAECIKNDPRCPQCRQPIPKNLV